MSGWRGEAHLKWLKLNARMAALWPGLKDKSPRIRAITRGVKDALERELNALHKLQAACQVALRDVPHQKDCPRAGVDAIELECECVRAKITDLEYQLAEQLQ